MAFTANDVLEIALRIERNGIRFYRMAAELPGLEAQRDKLIELAEMESEHEQTFQEMQATLSETERSASLAGTDSHALEQIQAIADRHVFDVNTEPEELLGGEDDVDDVLATAIGLEKESVLYYAALREVVTAVEAKRKLREIIIEELTHVAQLSGQRAQAAGTTPDTVET